MSDVPTAGLPSELRLGIDGDALRNPLSGVGRYILNLCRELERILPNAHLFAYSRFPRTRLVLPSARWVLRTEPSKVFRRLPSFVWLKTRGGQMCRRDRLHLFWAGRTLHPRLSEPVCTVCSVHDLNHLIVPETMQRATLWSHRVWFEKDVALAHAVVANSHGTAARVGKLLHRQVSGIVAPGLAEDFRSVRQNAPEVVRELAAIGVVSPYLLSVATLEPRKNAGALIRAFVALKRAGKLADYRLVLAGTMGWPRGELRRLLSQAARYGVVTTGYVKDELLPTLYARAELFVLPSFYEGFGMPVLEARACGTKVLVSDIPELREAAGSGGVAVEASVAGLTEGIERALATPNLEDGGALVESCSWTRAAEQLAEILVQAVRKQMLGQRRSV
ncbi:MAG TPA: glycosyltransferase family 1 protein [Polyangiaceae bacterium]